MTDDINILLVDDDEIDRRAILRGLVECGITQPVRTARNGKEAMAVLNGTESLPPMPNPCIILTDLNMPMMDGRELLREIKTNETLKSNVVFVLSTTSDPAEIQSCYDEGATGFMSKMTIAQDLSLLVDFLRIYDRLVTFPA